MRKITFNLVLAVLSCFVSVGVSDASNLEYGQLYHPKFGNVPYIFNLDTGYVYFPTLNYGTYVQQDQQTQQPQSDGIWRQDSSSSPGPIAGIQGPNGLGHYGPFATTRRALEVVRMFQARGYPNTIQFHNGDGQYVLPRR